MLCKHKKDLAKAESIAASARPQEAAHRVMRACVRIGRSSVLSRLAMPSISMAVCARDPEVVVVCGYDSDFFVLVAWPAVLYGQGLQGVMKLLSWKAVADRPKACKGRVHSPTRMSTA